MSQVNVFINGKEIQHKKGDEGEVDITLTIPSGGPAPGNREEDMKALLEAITVLTEQLICIKALAISILSAMSSFVWLLVWGLGLAGAYHTWGLSLLASWVIMKILGAKATAAENALNKLTEYR